MAATAAVEERAYASPSREASAPVALDAVSLTETPSVVDSMVLVLPPAVVEPVVDPRVYASPSREVSVTVVPPAVSLTELSPQAAPSLLSVDAPRAPVFASPSRRASVTVVTAASSPTEVRISVLLPAAVAVSVVEPVLLVLPPVSVTLSRTESVSVVLPADSHTRPERSPLVHTLSAAASVVPVSISREESATVEMHADSHMFLMTTSEVTSLLLKACKRMRENIHSNILRVE